MPMARALSACAAAAAHWRPRKDAPVCPASAERDEADSRPFSRARDSGFHGRLLGSDREQEYYGSADRRELG